VAAWLTEADGADAIALRAVPAWDGEPVLLVGTTRVRVVPCPTPLAARAALHDRAADEKLVLLTELPDAALGDGLLAHLSRQSVRSLNAWELVRQMFGGVTLDPGLPSGRKWLPGALSDHQPADGWPAPPGTVLTRAADDARFDRAFRAQPDVGSGAEGLLTGPVRRALLDLRSVTGSNRSEFVRLDGRVMCVVVDSWPGPGAVEDVLAITAAAVAVLPAASADGPPPAGG
jgi:hypothetical protein